MKNILILAAGAIGIGLGIMIYRRRNHNKEISVEKEPVFIPKKHHLTSVFSNAKKHLLN